MTSSLSFRNIAVVALQQIALAAVVALLVIGWLHVPDANTFEVFASVALALLIAIAACGGETMLALRMTRRPATTRHLLVGTVVVFAAALLWYAASTGLDHLAASYEARLAGYLNSRAPASLRNFFSYEHFMLWFGYLKFVLDWSLTGLLAAMAFAIVACHAPVRELFAIFRSGRCWLALLLVAVVGGWLTWALLGWTPGHGLRLEAFSLVLRMATVIVLNAAAVALLLQSMARAVLPVQSKGNAEPETSQPRTAAIP